jgi:hypothetical protein
MSAAPDLTRNAGALAMPDPADNSPDTIRSFVQLLAALEDGTLLAELSQEQSEIVAALNNHRAEYGGKPKATIALSFEFTLDGQTIQVRVKHDLKLPKGERSSTVLWTTPDNNLCRDNPKQQRLPFGVPVAGAPQSGRSV